MEQGFKITENFDEAEYIFDGKLTVTSGEATIFKTNMKPRYIDLDITIRSNLNGQIKRINIRDVSPHLEEFQGATEALEKAIELNKTELVDLP